MIHTSVEIKSIFIDEMPFGFGHLSYELLNTLRLYREEVIYMYYVGGKVPAKGDIAYPNSDFSSGRAAQSSPTPNFGSASDTVSFGFGRVRIRFMVCVINLETQL